MERIKYLSAFVGVAASLLAGVSVAFVFDKEVLNEVKGIDPRLMAISGLAAAMTVFAAITMLYTLRERRLRERLRRVFIIYAKEDQAVASEIANLIRESGMEPWLDVENITAGQIWMDEMAKALDESAMAVVLVSQNLNKSTYASKELKSAISDLEANDKKSSPLIPILIDDSEMPSSISHIQFVDFKKDDAKKFLVRSLEVAMDRILGAEPSS